MCCTELAFSLSWRRRIDSEHFSRLGRSTICLVTENKRFLIVEQEFGNAGLKAQVLSSEKVRVLVSD